MAVETVAVPAAPAEAPAAPAGPTDYAANAVAALEALAEPAEAAASAPAKVEEKPTKADEKVAKTDEKPAEKPAEKSRLELSYEQLAKEKAEFRREKEAAAGLEGLKPVKQAIDKKDPLAYLAAGGFSYKQVADAILGKNAPEAEVVEKTEVEKLKETVAQMQSRIAQENDNRARAQLHGDINLIVEAGGDRFKYMKHHKAEGQAVAYIEHFVRTTGSLPVEKDLKASLEVAAEAVEQHFRKQGEAWKGLLTSAQEPASVPPTKEVAASPTVSGGKTLTSAMTGPQPVRQIPTPRTTEDFQAQALEKLLEFSKQ